MRAVKILLFSVLITVFMTTFVFSQTKQSTTRKKQNKAKINKTRSVGERSNLMGKVPPFAVDPPIPLDLVRSDTLAIHYAVNFAGYDYQLIIQKVTEPDDQRSLKISIPVGKSDIEGNGGRVISVTTDATGTSSFWEFFDKYDANDTRHVFTRDLYKNAVYFYLRCSNRVPNSITDAKPCMKFLRSLRFKK